MRDDNEREDIAVALKLLPDRSKKGQIFVPRNTATKKKSISEPGKQEKHDEEDHAEDERNSDDAQTFVLSSRFKEQAPFEEKVSFERMRN